MGDDTISRKAAIEAIKQHVEVENDYTDIYHDGYCDGIYDAIDALEDMPSAQPEKRTEERTETHACDLISRQAAIECDGFREVERDDERRSN